MSKCKRSHCTLPVGHRRVVLIDPNGNDAKRCGPYCEACTDALLGVLVLAYTDGNPAVRVDEVSLCPEAEYRAGLSEDDFWAHVYRHQTGEGEPDDVAVDLDGITNQTEPCPVCGEFGACSYDAEGRELVHVIPSEVDE